jgi:PIN domain nuclease of toxin-antitoxin system
MKLLLDTHIWLWSFLEPEKLTRRVAGALENARNELWLSPISVWEVMLLSQKGRVELHEEVGSWVATAMKTVAFREAPITHEIALETQHIDLPHRDPADRFLVATAKVLGLTLVTADESLIRAKAVPVLANH